MTDLKSNGEARKFTTKPQANSISIMVRATSGNGDGKNLTQATGIGCAKIERRRDEKRDHQ
jgi:hypothetical protein